ncbi:MAG: RHS repeat-associated core domain-containing protein [Candidatus Zixiibacteriota bacterium]
MTATGQEPVLTAKPVSDECIVSDVYITRYLYDNGVLVATFDENDNVIDMFVNGPEGMIATYHENDDAQLYYFLTDQIGSPRVIMHSPGGGITPQVAQYNNYHPFGQIHQSWGSFNTPYTFTGKEQDDDGDFKFHYFGARYYDARIGMFSSIDKASQFAGGYLYGGNNPILGRDPDGNLFFLTTPFLFSVGMAAFSGAGAYYAEATHNPYMNGSIGGAFGAAALGGVQGAISGTIGAGLGWASGQIGWTSTFGYTVRGAASSVIGGGIGNSMDGNPRTSFFSNWGWSALQGAYTGYMAGKEYQRYLANRLADAAPVINPNSPNDDLPPRRGNVEGTSGKEALGYAPDQPLYGDVLIEGASGNCGCFGVGFSAYAQAGGGGAALVCSDGIYVRLEGGLGFYFGIGPGGETIPGGVTVRNTSPKAQFGDVGVGVFMKGAAIGNVRYDIPYYQSDRGFFPGTSGPVFGVQASFGYSEGAYVWVKVVSW